MSSGFIVGFVTTASSLFAMTAVNACADDTVYFQAHRGGIDEVPEDTVAAMRYAWRFKGAVPEVDIATTKDHAFVIMHDATLARTTDAPESIRDTPISQLTLAQVRSCDAGIRFGQPYQGLRVPTYEEILDEMAEAPGRRIYLDIRNSDCQKVIAELTLRHLEDRVIFVHGNPNICAELRRLDPKAGAMTWLGGAPETLKRRYETLKAEGFPGLTQLQFHLHTKDHDRSTEFVLDEPFLRQAFQETQAAGVDLQIRPFNLNTKCIKRLLDIGIRWYVADAPRRFTQAVAEARATH